MKLQVCLSNHWQPKWTIDHNNVLARIVNHHRRKKPGDTLENHLGAFMSTPCLPLLSLESPRKTSSHHKLKVLSQLDVCDMSWGLPKPCNSGKIIIVRILYWPSQSTVTALGQDPKYKREALRGSGGSIFHILSLWLVMPRHGWLLHWLVPFKEVFSEAEVQSKNRRISIHPDLQNRPFHPASYCAREASKEEAPDCGCCFSSTSSTSGFEI